MRKMKHNNDLDRRDGPMDLVPEEFLPLAQKVGASYTRVEPSAEFRAALHSRLVAEAARLQEQPLPASRGGLVARAAIGAAAVSVAGIALVAWRTKAIPTLVAHAQGQVRTADGS